MRLSINTGRSNMHFDSEKRLSRLRNQLRERFSNKFYNILQNHGDELFSGLGIPGWFF